ncbi:MFS transporter [Schumannella soli]|nr:MFS transporter [Schumannella soli]
MTTTLNATPDTGSLSLTSAERSELDRAEREAGRRIAAERAARDDAAREAGIPRAQSSLERAGRPNGASGSLAAASAPAASAPAAQRPRRTFGFVLAGLATTLMLAGASAPSPFYPHLEQSLGIGALGVTIAFAVYAVVLLATLLTAGSISDHLGRRPVIAVGFLVLAISVVVLWHASSGGMLYLARAIQGAASGVLVSTLSATIQDFAPSKHPQRATLVNALAPGIGLASGTVVAGLLLQGIGDVATAATWTFLPITLVYVALAGLIWVAPESSRREPGWQRSLAPRAAVPASARRLFVISVPVVLAGWATGGLFFSLGPTIVRAELGVESQIGDALVVALLPASGAVAGFILRNRRPKVPAVYGAAALAVGTALMIVALSLTSLPIYLVAVAIAGSGFGTAFMGTIGSLVPLAALHERAELFASLFIVAYLSFGIPAVVAGLLSGALGLHTTVLAYAVVVTLAAGIAALLRARSGRAPRPSAGASADTAAAA